MPFLQAQFFFNCGMNYGIVKQLKILMSDGSIYLSISPTTEDDFIFSRGGTHFAGEVGFFICDELSSVISSFSCGFIRENRVFW